MPKHQRETSEQEFVENMIEKKCVLVRMYLEYVLPITVFLIDNRVISN